MAFTGMTDDQGQLLLTLPAGTYTVSAIPPAGFQPLADQPGVVVTAGAVAEVQFQLAAVIAADGSLHIVALDGNGAPVAGVSISAA